MLAPTALLQRQDCDCRSSRLSDRLQIVCRGFAGALVGDDLVGDLLPFIQVTNSSPFDRADMDENIGTLRIGLNEPEAALNHFTVPVAIVTLRSD